MISVLIKLFCGPRVAKLEKRIVELEKAIVTQGRRNSVISDQLQNALETITSLKCAALRRHLSDKKLEAQDGQKHVVSDLNPKHYQTSALEQICAQQAARFNTPLVTCAEFWEIHNDGLLSGVSLEAFRSAVIAKADKLNQPHTYKRTATRNQSRSFHPSFIVSVAATLK